MKDRKLCSSCDQVKPASEFAHDKSRADGLTYSCKACRNEALRTRHKRKTTRGPYGPPPAKPRDGDKRQSKARINHLIRTGKLPHPSTLACSDCGRPGPAWFDRPTSESDVTPQPPTIRHEYLHHLGYSAEHYLDVIVVCSRCRGKRQRRSQ